MYPDRYKEIKELVNKKRAEREEYTNLIIEQVTAELEKNHIKGKVTGRPKHLYSIYKKMYEKEVKFADLYDLIAIRIIVEKEVECDNILGIIHNLYIPVSGRFKDYIAVPKKNGYQSIHTTVIGPKNQNFEIQIRTNQMHQIAEEGVAAHWKYKEKKSKDKNEKYYTAVRQMIEKNTQSNEQQKVKLEKPTAENKDTIAKNYAQAMLNQTIFIFTPKEDVMEMPINSTALDFAFQVHTQIGYRTIGAKVNDKIVPL